MRPFSFLYRKVMSWARHRHAPRYLFALSFAESSFFPVPPDVMLAPMALGRPDKGWRFALICTVGSALGGLLGYAIGLFAIEAIQPWLLKAGYEQAYERAHQWFAAWGFWAIFIAGFSPIPYKIFTIAAGAMGMALLPFTVASLVGRGARFYLVTGLMLWGGERMERQLQRYIEVLGWAVVVIAAVAYLILRR